MRQLVAANLKFHARRYVATIVAVAIAVAFVAAALVFGGALSYGIKNEVAGQYRGSAAVVQGWSDKPDWRLQDEAAVVTAVPGVESIYLNAGGSALVDDQWMSLQLLPTGQIGALNLEEGTLPTSPSAAVVSANAADRLDLEVGSTLLLSGQNMECDDTGCEPSDEPGPTASVTVDGIVGRGSGSLANSVQDLWVSEEVLDTVDPYWSAYQILVGTDSPDPSNAEQDALKAELEAALVDADLPDVSAWTAYEVIDEQLEMINSDQAVMTLMLLLFPVIAGVVAMIVVSTTFQVVFRQRERELGLLRVLGGTGSQIRRLMLLESAAVGFVGSLIGAAIGVLGGAAAVSAAGVVPSFAAGLSGVSWVQVLALLLACTLFAMLAGFRPAARASRVPPVVAVAGAPQTVQSISRRSRILAAVAAVATVGLGVLTWVKAHAPEEQKVDGFVLVLGLAVLTLAAVITLVVAVLPLVTRALGRLGRSESYRLAAANSARNPGRTAATGVAIFIGVALIAMVTVGAQSLRATAHSALNRQAPVDLTVSAGPEPLTSTEVESLDRIAGIEAMAVVDGLPATASWAGTGWGFNGTLLDVTDVGDAARGEMPTVGPDEVLMPWNDSGDPEPAEICVAETCVPVEGVPSGQMVGSDRFLTTPEVLASFDQDPEPMQVWLKLENPDDYAKVLSEIQAISPDLAVDGQVALRAAIDQIVNIMVLVVVALLGVSVLVALVGITNTLSLSVAERTRENGLLRALGMTKRQVRSMLSWEALLIALVSTAFGLGIGAYFGIVGFSALPIGIADANRIIEIPWLQWALIVVVAVGSALIASIVPGRKASRVSPVEALASE